MATAMSLFRSVLASAICCLESIVAAFIGVCLMLASQPNRLPSGCTCVVLLEFRLGPDNPMNVLCLIMMAMLRHQSSLLYGGSHLQV